MFSCFFLVLVGGSLACVIGEQDIAEGENGVEFEDDSIYSAVVETCMG